MSVFWCTSECTLTGQDIGKTTENSPGTKEFLKMIRARQIAERIGEKAEPWPTLILVLKEGKEKLFQEYIVDVRGHSEVSQNMLDYSRGGILS